MAEVGVGRIWFGQYDDDDDGRGPDLAGVLPLLPSPRFSGAGFRVGRVACRPLVLGSGFFAVFLCVGASLCLLHRSGSLSCGGPSLLHCSLVGLALQGLLDLLARRVVRL